MKSSVLATILALGVVLCVVGAPGAEAAVSCKGQQYTAKATAYYPDDSETEGGFVDCKDTKLNTLQDYLAGNADYVSVAMDKNKKIKYGTKLCIPEINKFYGKTIEFRVVDSGSSFTGKGFSRIDICVANEQESLKDLVNGKLTLIFPSLSYGSPCCSC
ncbi:hypothetical protein CHUAL_012903 [Chamberlinius hualienensis]